jgi:hypothetical protein
VERAWGYSFVSPSGAPDNQAFVTAMRKLLNGEPVGLATDPSFDMRYADMSSALSANLEELEWDPDYIGDYELAHIWTANNDARGYVVIGDPAARIPFALPNETPAARPAIPQVSATLTKPRVETEVAAAEVEDEPQAGPEPYQAKAALDFGLQVSDLTGSIKQFTNQLASALGKAASNITTLEVSTYTTDDIQGVMQGNEAQAKLRAFTRVAFDGDTKVYVPTKVGSVEEDLWKLHAEMVREAQANRAQFLQSMAQLATNLLKNLNL